MTEYVVTRWAPRPALLCMFAMCQSCQASAPALCWAQRSRDLRALASMTQRLRNTGAVMSSCFASGCHFIHLAAACGQEWQTPLCRSLRRWYRAPELLLSCDHYTAAIDVWCAPVLPPNIPRSLMQGN